MKEHLEQLVQTVKDTQLVERLMAASSLEERVAICKEAKETPEFKEFMEHYNEATAGLNLEEKSVFSSKDLICTKDNAVEIGLILIIEGIDDSNMFAGRAWSAFIEAFYEIEGTHERIAEHMINFFYSSMVTEYTLEQILKLIF